MNTKRLLLQMAGTFVVVFIVNAIVVYLYNLIVHGAGAFDWDTTFFFAISLGVALPIIHLLEHKGKA